MAYLDVHYALKDVYARVNAAGSREDAIIFNFAKAIASLSRSVQADLERIQRTLGQD